MVRNQFVLVSGLVYNRPSVGKVVCVLLSWECAMIL